MSEPVSEKPIYLELGSIIQIEAPTNIDIHNKIYFIDYLDDNVLKLIDTETNTDLILNKVGGLLGDESIETINILSIPEEKGFARQNNLLVGRGISIRFGGDEPVIVNGKITNLRDDMIELTTFPDNKLLYINFDYKGIPLDLPIIDITPFNFPSEITEMEKEGILGDIQELSTNKNTPDLKDLEMTPEVDFDIDDREITQEKIKARRRDVLVEADDIIFGEDLGEVTQTVNVSQDQKRYSIQSQTTDLLDELLATIPSSQRTPVVLNKVHTMIERYEQLREKYSLFDKEGQAINIRKKGHKHKPLVDSLVDLDKSLDWIMPIVRNKKKVYDVDLLTVTASEDIIPHKLNDTLNEHDETFMQYVSGEIPDDQNKYYYLMSKINQLHTPFTSTDDTENLIVKKQINHNFNAIVNNLGDFYSAAVKGISGDEKKKSQGLVTRGRFITTRYTEGLQGIIYPSLKQIWQKIPSQPKQLTQNDRMDIIGFVTLSKAVFKYSTIKLPLTNILKKVGLHQINFLLNDILSENTETVNHIIKPQDEYQIDNKTLINKINYFHYKQNIDYEDRDEKSYRDYLNTLVPSTDILFEMIKNDIVNDSSYYAIIQYLEPFLVYTNDITYPIYRKIMEYMREKIAERKKIIMSNIPEFSKYINQKSYDNPDIILPLLSTANQVSKTKVTDSYKFSSVDSCDVLREINSIDGGRLFYNNIAIDILDLGTSIDMGEKLEGELQNFTHEVMSNDSNECSPLVLSKKYIALDELTGDDDTEDVYFDKKYDTTRYDIIDSFPEWKMLDSDDVFNQLVFHLQENVGLKEQDALTEASAILEGKRRVQDGDYALLDHDGDLHYYVREDNKWRLDDTLRGQDVDQVAFCNLKTKCLSIKNECGDSQENTAKMNKQLVEEILKHFEGQNHIDSEQLRVLLSTNYNESLRTIELLKAIQFYEARKYDMEKIQIALLLEDQEKPVSPYQKILNVILGQSDFVSKQRNIGLFIDKYCRESFYNPTAENQEDPHWFYCPITNTKLLPTFFYNLSKAYYDNTYLQVLDEICAERGTKSDDGDMIVDKYSGYIIRRLEFDEMEGYDAAGRPMISYDLLQKDKGDLLIDILDMKKEELYKDKNAQVINRVITVLDKSMGISVSSQYEFIIRHTIRRLTQELKTKKQYEKLVLKNQKLGKSMAPYSSYVNEYLLFYTLAYYLVALQTVTPSVQTMKTFGTGCKKSFYGYPTESMGDMSSLDYLACVVMNLKSDAEPWNTLPSLTKKVKLKIKGKGKEARVSEEKKLITGVASKIKILLDKKVLIEEEVQEKITLKRLYLETSSEADMLNIPIDIDVKGWHTFLPPLITQEVRHLYPIKSEFSDLLLQEMGSGNPSQFDRLHKLFGFIFYYSLGIQEEIQKIVNKVSMILSSKGTNVPYLENACCNEGTFNTYDYFVEGSKQIQKYNDTVKKLSLLYYGAIDETRSPYLFNSENTKMEYTTLKSHYSERTIYHSFIYFCANNPNIDMATDIITLCGDIDSTLQSDDFKLKTLYNEIEEYYENLGSAKSDIPYPLDDRIAILKRNGYNFTNDALVNMVNAVNNQRIVNIDLNPSVVSAKHALEGVLKYLKDKKNPLLCGKNILEKLYDLMDRFYVEYSEASDENVIELLAYLQEFNTKTVNTMLETMGKTADIKQDIEDFIKEVVPERATKGTFKKNMARQENFILNWRERGQNIFMKQTDATDFAVVEYLKIMTFNLAKVYPNMIKNQTSFKSRNIPKHWRLFGSEFMTGELKDIIYKEYKNLDKFFGDKQLSNILNNVILKTDDLLLLMNATPFFAEMENKTIMSGKILKELMYFYLLCCFNIYMDSIMEVPAELVLDDTGNNDDELNVEETQMALSLEAELLSGKDEERIDVLNDLLLTYLEMMLSYKKVLNYSNADIIEDVLRAKEREKNKITTRLGDLSVDEREIENIMKNQRLGDWSLGQTKALFVYDNQQYDKERREMEEDMLVDFQLQNNENIVASNREIYKTDVLNEREIERRIDAEVYAINVAEDDDIGDNDDEYQIMYGDAL